MNTLTSLGLNKAILDDGVYDVEKIPFIFLEEARAHRISDTDAATIRDFVKEYGEDKIVVAAPYETYGIYLFAKKPKKWSMNNAYGYMGRGSNLLIPNCPRTVLILAEND